MTLWNDADIPPGEDRTAAAREPHQTTHISEEESKVASSPDHRAITNTTRQKFSTIDDANNQGTGYVPPPTQQWKVTPQSNQTRIQATSRLRLAPSQNRDANKDNNFTNGVSATKGKQTCLQSVPKDHEEDEMMEDVLEEEDFDEPAHQPSSSEPANGAKPITSRTGAKRKEPSKTTPSRKVRFQPPRGKGRAVNYLEDANSGADNSMEFTNDSDDDAEEASDAEWGRISAGAQQDPEESKTQEDAGDATTAAATSVANVPQPPAATAASIPAAVMPTASIPAAIMPPPATTTASTAPNIPAMTAPGAPTGHLGLDEHFVLGRPRPAGALVPTNHAMTAFQWVPRRGAVNFNSAREVELLNRWKQQLVRRACQRLAIVRDGRATRAH